MTTVKKGGPPGKDPPISAEGAAQSRVGGDILKARNAAGKQAKSAPHAEYQRPHRAHVGAFVREARDISHKKMLEDEAGRNQLLETGAQAIQREDDLDDSQRLTGINFDEDRKKRGRKRDQDDDDEREDAEDAVALGQAAAEKGFAQKEGGGKYFQDLPDDRMGDLSLTNPNEMKRLLGPSVRFAQHAMLLAEDRLKTGLDRVAVIEFLASLYLGVADRAYALKALREFGTGTGIIDIYPLEVMKNLLENVPGFFTKIAVGRFFVENTTGVYKSETGTPIVLSYDPALRIRGFALDGGPRPGYLFEPVDPPGTYHLTFQTPGTFKVMVSAIAKNGVVAIEELAVEIVQGTATIENAAAIQRERAHDASPASGEEASTEEPSDPSAKKDDLTIHFPKRI